MNRTIISQTVQSPLNGLFWTVRMVRHCFLADMWLIGKMAKATAYAMDSDLYTYDRREWDRNYATWWLRSPGNNSNNAANVNSNGAVNENGNNVNNTNIGVRPALLPLSETACRCNCPYWEKRSRNPSRNIRENICWQEEIRVLLISFLGLLPERWFFYGSNLLSMIIWGWYEWFWKIIWFYEFI